MPPGIFTGIDRIPVARRCYQLPDRALAGSDRGGGDWPAAGMAARTLERDCSRIVNSGKFSKVSRCWHLLDVSLGIGVVFRGLPERLILPYCPGFYCRSAEVCAEPKILPCAGSRGVIWWYLWGWSRNRSEGYAKFQYVQRQSPSRVAAGDP